MGDIIRFVEGPLHPVEEAALFTGRNPTPDTPGVVFVRVWEEAARALASVYDRTTLKGLVDHEHHLRTGHLPDYTI